jgi:GxxExxY protein
MLADDPALTKITELVIGCAYKVANMLGVGFLEKVYENALVHEIRKCELLVEQQRAVDVWYDGVVVGVYLTDILVAGSVIVEVKSVASLGEFHGAQAMNYFRATGLNVALLINFGRSHIEIKRIANSSTSASKTSGPRETTQ